MTDANGDDAPLTVLLDANLAASVGKAFEAAGHRVIYHNEVLAEGAADTVVARIARENGAVIAGHDKDFKQIVKDDRFKHLGLILFECSNPLAIKRAEHFMSLIEHEWRVSCRKRACRLRLTIRKNAIFSYR